MKEAYYFSHDANARLDDKILELRSEFGWHGYGLFWAIIETLRDCSNYTYPSNATAGLALSLNIAKADLENFILKCLDLRLLVEEDGAFYSESLMKRMEDIDHKRRKRAEAGRKGGNAKAMLQQKPSIDVAKASKESKVKESKEESNTIPEVPAEAKAPDKYDAFLKVFNDLTKRSFKTLDAKTKTQFDKLRKGGNKYPDFVTAITNGFKDSHSWPKPALFTPEYITREKEFLKYLNWEIEKAPEVREPKAFNSLEEQYAYWGGKPKTEAA